MRLLHEIVVPRITVKWDVVAIYLGYEVECKQLIKKDVIMIQRVGSVGRLIVR